MTIRLAVFIVAAITGASFCCGADEYRSDSHFRRPVAAVALDDGECVAVAHRDSGSVSIVETGGWTVVAAGIGGSTSAAPSTVARINYFGAAALLTGLHHLLVGGSLHAAVAIASNSATAVPMQDLSLVEACLADDEDQAAKLADALDGEAVYAMSKLALARKVRRLAVEWAPGVRVNAVAPGPVLTPLTEAALEHPVTGDLIRQYPIPLDRWGEKTEIAHAVWFLLSPESSWTTGTVLFADGGTDALLNPDRL